MNDTLFEISREIESSRLSSHEDSEKNLENRGSDINTDASQASECGIEEKRKTVTLDSTRSDETVILGGSDATGEHETDKESYYMGNDEYQTSSLTGERDCSSACTESTIDDKSVCTESTIDDNKSVSSDRADPNDVMRDWLSNIKPPPSPANIKLVVNKERFVTVDTEDAPPSLPRKMKSRERRGRPVIVPELPLSDYSSTAEIPRIVSTATSSGEISRSNSTASHDDLFEKIDQLIRFERRDSDNTLCLSTASGRSSSSSGVGGVGKTATSTSNRDRLDSGLQSVSSDSGSSPYPSPNVTRAPISSRHQHHMTSQHQQQHTIREESYGNDHVFRDNNDSDFSEWSPVSTLASNRSGSATPQSQLQHRPRSNSVTVSPRQHSARRRQLRTSNSTGHMSVNGITMPRCIDSNGDTSHEMAAIEKFLKLTNTYLNNKDVDEADQLSSTISLGNVSLVFFITI